MANEKFVVHKVHLDEADLVYLRNNSTITNGFAPNSPAYAAAVNAILHETSLFVTAFAENVGTSTINPTMSKDDIKPLLTSYLVGIKPTNATTADKVANSLSMTINSQPYSFNGNSAVTLPTIFVPTANGGQGQLLIANANAAPSWLSTSLGATNVPIYINAGVPTECTTFAGATALTLNGTTKAGSTASLYAPVSNSIASDSSSYDNTVWYNTSGNPVFGKAPFAHKTIDSSWPATKRVCHAITSSNAYTTSNENDTKFAGFTQGMKYDSTNGVVYADEYVWANADYTGGATAATKDGAFRWSFWGWSNQGEKMSLTLTSSGAILSVKGAITATGTISSTGQITASSFNATSDIRKKCNIKDYTPAKSILDLSIKEFDLKSDGSHHIGCIAQDLQQIAPELVHEDDKGYLSIEETKLVYLLLDEVKKLRKELDDLKNK